MNSQREEHGQLALKTAKAIVRIDPYKLPGGVNQAMAQAQCLILDAIQAATEQGVGEPVAWSFCPECGCSESHVKDKTLRICSECGQDWHTHIDYIDVVRSNLSRAQPPKPTGGGVPKGWTLAPIEPTDEIKSAMRNAVDAAYLAKLEGIGGEASDWALQSYRAALLATQGPDD